MQLVALMSPLISELNCAACFLSLGIFVQHYTGLRQHGWFFLLHCFSHANSPLPLLSIVFVCNDHACSVAVLDEFLLDPILWAASYLQYFALQETFPHCSFFVYRLFLSSSIVCRAFFYLLPTEDSSLRRPHFVY